MEGYSVCVCGSGGVGKTCMNIRLTQDKFDPAYIPTIADTFKANITVDGKTYSVDLLDTAGQDELQSLTESFMSKANAFIIVYSVTSPASFEECKSFYQRIKSNTNGKPLHIVLVGNKCDLDDERAVQPSEGQALAQEWNCAHYECSAKANINVKEVFEAALAMCLPEKSGASKTESDGQCCIVA